MVAGQTAPNSTSNSPFSKSKHKAQLKSIRKEAEDFAGTNKNKSALQQLRRYDRVSDSLFAIECRDTISAIDASFKAGSSEKLDAISKNRKAMDENGKSLDENRGSFFSLFKRSLFALGVWLLILLVILKIRNRKVRRVEAQLAVARLQSDASEKTSEKGHTVVEDASKMVDGLITAAEHSQRAETEFRTVIAGMTSGSEEAGVATKKLKALSGTVRLISREAHISDILARQENPASEEKSKVSMNDLCDEALEICYRGHCMDPDSPFECQVTRDLEKNLPLIAVYPEEVAAILISIIDNAFLAVKEKAAKQEKGYSPKVGISTRILPRFIQVRIKDNGGGIAPNEIERVQEEYFSKRPKGEGAGMGLPISKKILTERHKGEMRIESEFGNSTDVYLKFYM